MTIELSRYSFVLIVNKLESRRAECKDYLKDNEGTFKAETMKELADIEDALSELYEVEK